MTTETDEILEGAIDCHCHGYPEISFDCKTRVEDLQTARLAAEAKMKGFVLKSHMWPTVGRAYQLKNQISGLEIWPSITLNDVVGGFSPWSTEAALKQGAKVIWMPTWSARNDLERQGASAILRRYLPSLDQLDIDRGLTVLTSQGEIKNSVREIICLAGQYDASIFTGHLSPEESIALAKEAGKLGFGKLVFGHPDSNAVGAQMAHIEQMAAMNFYIEFTFLGLLPPFQRIKLHEVCQRIRRVGAERSILTTDAFFEWMPPPPEMMRMFIALLLEHGISREEIEIMVKENPSRLLGLS